MASNVKSYFEHHAQNYSDRHIQFYPKLAEYIINIAALKNSQQNSRKKDNYWKNTNAKSDDRDHSHKLMVLDVGCGNGSFIKALIEKAQQKIRKQENNENAADIDAHVNYCILATDMSFEMIKLAKENLASLKHIGKDRNYYDVELFVSYAFNLPLRPHKKVDIIHIDSVLHHLVDRTRMKSTLLAKRLIDLLVNLLLNSNNNKSESFDRNSQGILIVEEWHFLSYIVPSISSFLIFYGLKLINLLKLDLSFTNEIRRGLQVNFLSPEQLHKILSSYSKYSTTEVHIFDRIKVKFPKSYRFFFLREKSHTTFILKVHKNLT
jgi:SAM-dependent methyltransferase